MKNVLTKVLIPGLIFLFLMGFYGLSIQTHKASAEEENFIISLEDRLSSVQLYTTPSATPTLLSNVCRGHFTNCRTLSSIVLEENHEFKEYLFAAPYGANASCLKIFELNSLELEKSLDVTESFNFISKSGTHLQCIGGHFETVAFADLNQDGHIDILMPTYEKTMLFVGKGNRTFVDETPKELELVWHAPAVEGSSLIDVNLDGKADIIVGPHLAINRTKTDRNEFSITEFQFLDDKILPTEWFMPDEGILVLDLEQNGFMEVVKINPGNGQLRIFGIDVNRQTHDITRVYLKEQIDLSTGETFGIDFGRLDNNNCPDLVVGGGKNATFLAKILYNNCSDFKITKLGENSPWAASYHIPFVVDINDDAKPDVVLRDTYLESFNNQPAKMSTVAIGTYPSKSMVTFDGENLLKLRPNFKKLNQLLGKNFALKDKSEVIAYFSVERSGGFLNPGNLDLLAAIKSSCSLSLIDISDPKEEFDRIKCKNGIPEPFTESRYFTVQQLDVPFKNQVSIDLAKAKTFDGLKVQEKSNGIQLFNSENSWGRVIKLIGKSELTGCENPVLKINSTSGQQNTLIIQAGQAYQAYDYIKNSKLRDGLNEFKFRLKNEELLVISIHFQKPIAGSTAAIQNINIFCDV